MNGHDFAQRIADDLPAQPMGVSVRNDPQVKRFVVAVWEPYEAAIAWVGQLCRLAVECEWSPVWCPPAPADWPTAQGEPRFTVVIVQRTAVAELGELVSRWAGEGVSVHGWDDESLVVTDFSGGVANAPEAFVEGSHETVWRAMKAAPHG